VLLEAKADIEASDNEGTTALMHTCGCRMGGQNITTARVLAEAKANLDASDNAGSTALDYAVATDHRTGLDQYANARGGEGGSRDQHGIGFAAAMRALGAERRGQGDGAWASRHI
jgi:ankyrin repeat protein